MAQFSINIQEKSVFTSTMQTDEYRGSQQPRRQASKRKSLRVALLADDILGLQCGKHIMEHNHEIVLFISNNHAAIQWARINTRAKIYTTHEIFNQRIEQLDYLIFASRTLTPSKQLLQHLKTPCIFYIENEQLIQHPFSPIAHSILEEKSSHSISWAYLNPKAHGQIIESATFKINPQIETSANAIEKSIYAATEILDAILNILQEVNLEISLGLEALPQAPVSYIDGIIDWQKDASDIERLSRALTFGKHINPHAVCKFYTGDDFFMVESITLCDRHEANSKPGTIIEHDNDSILVSTQTGVVKLSGIRRVTDGSVISLQHALPVNSQLPALADEKRELLRNTRIEYYNDEAELLPFLSLPPSRNPYFDNHQKKQQANTQSLVVQLEKTTRLVDFFSVVICYLLRMSQTKTLLLPISSTIKNSNPSFKAILAQFFSYTDNTTFIDIRRKVGAIFNQHFKLISVDSAYRYPSTESNITSWLQQNSLFLCLGEINTLQQDGLAFCFNKQKKQASIHFRSTLLSDQDALFITQQIANHLSYIWQQFLTHETININTLCFFDTQAVEQMGELFNLNSPATAIPEATLGTQLKQKFQQFAEHIAIIENGIATPYADLDQESNTIAQQLQQKVPHAKRVAIRGHRGKKEIVAIIAAIKAGMTFVPFDKKHPFERLAYILHDACVDILIDIKEDIEIHKVKKSTSQSDCTYYDSEQYIVYTSGSTGTPKGVIVGSSSLQQLISWQQEALKLETGMQSSVALSIGFDPSLLEILPPLFAGMSLHITPENLEKNAGTFTQWFIEQHIQVILLPTAITKQILSNPPTLSYPVIIATGGEKLSPLTHPVNNLKVYNLYGPSECTVQVSAKEINAAIPNTLPPTIGRPLNNTQVFIVNKELQVNPIGITGEIVVAGQSLAIAYTNPELTRKSFIDIDIFACTYRAYLTGDMARWLPNGEIDFVGRDDKQIKVRGFRVELTEIETRLLEFDNIREACVINTAVDSTQLLTAYVTAKNPGHEIDVIDLKKYLKQHLPEYMLPSTIFVLDQLPLAVNEKIDKRVLQDIVYNLKAKKIEHPEEASTEELIIDWLYNKLPLKQNSLKSSTNIFELGIDSILAANMLNNLSALLGKSIPHFLAHQYPVIGTLAFEIDQLDTFSHDDQLTSYNADKLPVLSYQLNLWHFYKIHAGNPCYNVSTVWSFSGKIDYTKLQQALNQLMQRQAALNCNFFEEDGVLYQKITKHNLSIKTITSNDRKQSLDYIEEITQKPFTLEKDCLTRLIIIEEKHLSLIILCCHHIIIDGFSISIFAKELSALYNQQTLPDLPSSYPQQLSQQKAHHPNQRVLNFWKKQLDSIQYLSLPFSNKQKHNENSGKTISTHSPETLITLLRKRAKQLNVSLFSLLYSAYLLILHRYTQQKDFIVAYPSYARESDHAQALIAYFINIITQRNHIDTSLTLDEFITTTHRKVEECLSHEINFDDILNKVYHNTNNKEQSLIQTLFTLQPDNNDALCFNGKTSSQADIHYSSAKFELSVSIIIQQEKLKIDFEYNDKLLDENIIQFMLSDYLFTLDKIVQHTQGSISQISLMKPENFNALLKLGKGQEADIKNDFVIDYIDSIIATYPNKNAIEFYDEHITFKQLDQIATNLASAIKQQLDSPGHRIIIFMPRGIELIASVLATIKTNNIWIPVSIDTPSYRLQEILESSQAEIILTPNNKASTLANINLGNTKAIDPIQLIKIEASPFVAIKQHDISYIIYTSGSTGKPKGVQITNKGVINTIEYQIKFREISANDRLLSASSVSFDVFVAQLLSSLFTGATFIMTDREDILPGRKFAALINNKKVTHMTITPSSLKALPDIDYPSLKSVITAGEKCSQKLVKTWCNKVPQFINAYGPTEAAICATMSICQQDKAPYIGSPIDNTHVYVLDQDLNLVPPGVAGELYIAGVGLSSGYLNNHTLNQKAFIKNPYSKKYSRIYKTGDIVKWHSSGELEYIGRSDDQVKIRGNRVEPQGVEQHLLQHNSVVNCYVAARKICNENQLVAYIISNDDTLQASDLRTFLSDRLQRYQIPRHYVFLEQFPQTLNGKIDTKKLPMPHDEKDAPTVPSTTTEKALLTIWKDAFKKDNIGIDDDFYDLGGHSILVIKIVDQINAKLNATLHAHAFISHTTIKALAELIDSDEILEENWLPLKTTGEQAPLILIHPMGGSVFWYQHYAKLINNRKVYAIQDPGISDSTFEFKSLDDMAEHYYRLIKNHIPHGPYIIGGASSGSNIALKIARLMQADYEKINAIISLDGWLNYPKEFDDQDFLERVLEDQRKAILERFDEHAIQNKDNWLSLQLKRGRLMKDYQAKSFSIPVILLKAQELLPIFNNVNAPNNYWDLHNQAATITHLVPGNHESMHYPEYAQAIADAINHGLFEVDKR